MLLIECWVVVGKKEENKGKGTNPITANKIMIIIQMN